METIVCDLCGADQPQVLYTGPGWKQPGLDSFALVRCRRCGLMYLSPRPTSQEIGIYYPEDYASFRPAIEDEHLEVMRWIRRRKLIQRRKLVEKYSGRTAGRVLDVGCATGLFLHEMAQAGWQAAGVEMSPHAAGYARQRFGLEIHQGQLAEVPGSPQSFDVITYWDVLEHTFSPAAELRRCYELLAPGGLVAINVPNWHSLDRWVFGPYWIGLDPPRHLYVFTRDTLTALLEKTGFAPLAWVCFMPSYYAFIISVDRWLSAEKPRLARPVNRLLNFPGVRFLFEPYFSLANRQQRGGVIAVFARKLST